jgi:hypothetical protein
MAFRFLPGYLFEVTKKSGLRGNPLSKAARISSGRYEMSIRTSGI